MVHEAFEVTAAYLSIHSVYDHSGNTLARLVLLVSRPSKGSCQLFFYCLNLRKILYIAQFSEWSLCLPTLSFTWRLAVLTALPHEHAIPDFACPFFFTMHTNKFIPCLFYQVMHAVSVWCVNAPVAWRADKEWSLQIYLRQYYFCLIWDHQVSRYHTRNISLDDALPVSIGRLEHVKMRKRHIINSTACRSYWAHTTHTGFLSRQSLAMTRWCTQRQHSQRYNALRLLLRSMWREFWKEVIGTWRCIKKHRTCTSSNELTTSPAEFQNVARFPGWCLPSVMHQTAYNQCVGKHSAGWEQSNNSCCFHGTRAMQRAMGLV